MFLPVSTVVAVFALTLAPTLAQQNDPTPDTKLTYKTLTNEEDEAKRSLQLHVFQPENWKASDRRAAIVFFFGGGWVSGTPKQFYPQCRHLADLGMVAISAEYRTRNSHGVTPEKCVEDGADAIAWVRNHAEELGIDVKRLAAGGGSAGGHVAATTGTGINPMKGDGRPALLVLFNPVLDTSPKGFKGAQVLGEKAVDISPLHHLDADVPPTVIFLGDADSIVPVVDAVEFRRQLASHGTDCELALYAGEPHGFFNVERRSYRDTLRVMDAFLRRHGFLH